MLVELKSSCAFVPLPCYPGGEREGLTLSILTQPWASGDHQMFLCWLWSQFKGKEKGMCMCEGEGGQVAVA